MFDPSLEVPEKEPLDYVHTAVKTAIASIPKWWAASGAEIFSLVIASPIEKRRDKFLEDVAWVVRETAAKVEDLQPEKLAQNEAFVSATLQAARIALSTHKREKREYLRNALLNIATGRAPSEDMQHIYLHLVDELTPSHVKILNFLWTGNSRVAAVYGGTLPQNKTFQQIFAEFEPEFQGEHQLVQQVLSDLKSRGLATLQTMSDSFPQQCITDPGIQFLRFVSTPEELR